MGALLPPCFACSPPPGRLGERAGGCGQAERGSPAPPPRAGITAPAGSRGLQLGSFVFLSPQHYLVLQLTRRWRGGLGTRDNIRNEHLSRDQEQGLLPAVGAPSAPGLEVGHRAPLLPPAQPRSEPFLCLDHAHQLQGFQGRTKVSVLSSFCVRNLLF